MKKLITFLGLSLSVIFLIVFASSTPIAAQNVAANYQRYITFHNDFDFPIYPVIQVPADICAGSQDTSVRRIVVNGTGQNGGLQPDETLTVFIPHNSVTVNDENGTSTVIRCWYKSGRIYIFPVNLTTLEQNMVKVDQNNSSQITTPDDPPNSVTCFVGKRDNYGKGASGNCFTGHASNSFAADIPAQLAEYTFDSDNAATNNDPDTGIAMADIDVSHVDDLYLPIAASVVNNGATGYMGGAMPLSQFQQRLSSFFTNVPWPKYSAYLSQNQPSNTIRNAIDTSQLPPDLGGGTTTPAPHLPAGFNSIQNTLSKATSSVYEINDSSSNYLISGVLDQPTQVQPYLDRWIDWVNQNGQPCSTTVMSQLIWPDDITSSFDKQGFCDQFSATVNTVWTHFLTDKIDGFNDNQQQFYQDCGLTHSTPDQNQTNACIIQHIVGYNSQVLGGSLPGQVQALLRGVAYNSADGLDPNHKQYQYDPFLTFAAPYNSQFNLNPYTRLIHSTKDGIGAVAYSFSIDDKYGNFRDASLGILIDAGGTKVLDNQQPYDPYQQYSMNWGYNRDEFSLLAVASGVDLANVQDKLQAIAANHNNQPFLIKQDQNISVFGHAAAAGTKWKLTNPLVTLTQLQNAAQQEKDRTNGATAYYQTLINYLFGNSAVQPPIQSIFPDSVWDGNSSTPAISLLNFDAGDAGWAVGQALLYGYISQQSADVPQKGNWVSADASQCGIPNPIAINGPGSQRLPVKLNQPCQVTLTDGFTGNPEKLVFSLTPVSKQVTDNYTGAQVTVMSLPVGNQTSGTPPTSSNLTEADQKFCQDNSTAGRMQGSCNNINVSAVWSGDPLSRDVVYMGLAFEDMPRVNVNLPNAPPDPPDPNGVNWPPNAAITVAQKDNANVTVSWSAAVAGVPVNYMLFKWDGTGWPRMCQTSETSCTVPGQQQTINLYVFASNASNPAYQSTNICYPAANPCPPASPTPSRSRSSRR